MAGLYVYAIIDRPDIGPLPWPGFGGMALASVPYHDIAAVVSPVEAETVQPLPANVRRHVAVVEALMSVATALPVRFGTLVPDEERLRTVLAEHHRDFAADFARVHGRVELGFRVLWPYDVDPAPARLDRAASRSERPGREYLLARFVDEQRTRALWQRARDLADELHRPLADLAHSSTRQVLRTPRLVLSAAYLVGATDIGRARAVVESLANAHQECQFLLTGPWPPYHFVAGGGPADVSSGEGGARTNVLT